MTDWAEERAREWLNEHSDAWHNVFVGDSEVYASLAALLRRVRGDDQAAAASDGWELGREDTLAAVRRVVAEVWAEFRVPSAGCADAQLACDEILSRLEKLGSPRLSTPEEALKVMGQGQPLVKMREIKP